MTATLTIRLPAQQREAFQRRAQALKKTESQFLREIIQREISEMSILDRVGHLAGSLDSTKTKRRAHSLKDYMRKQNWRC